MHLSDPTPPPHSSRRIMLFLAGMSLGTTGTYQKDNYKRGKSDPILGVILSHHIYPEQAEVR